MNCPSCNHPENEPAITPQNTPQFVFYRRCLGCGVYFQPSTSTGKETAFYASGQYRNAHRQPNERQFQQRRADNIIRYIKQPRVYIDVGCSMGVLIDTVTEKYPDCKTFGVDLDPVLTEGREIYRHISLVPALADCPPVHAYTAAKIPTA
jgi:hypothetical protein